MDKIVVLSVNISEVKGVVKKPVESITLNNHGVLHDAHSGPWHRQVSLLARESFDRFSLQAGRQLVYGEFAENITTQGVELVNTSPLDRFVGEHVELEVTQIGKECHGTSCAIFREVGNCVMPKEGIFARVIRQGTLKAGDVLEYVPRVWKIKVVTLSDRASRGEYEDRSGPRVVELLNQHFSSRPRNIAVESIVIADDAAALNTILDSLIKDQTDILITTGGTGIGPRDITVDVIKPRLEKEIPGIMEMIRVKYGASKPNALLSRSVAGVMGNALVYTLPGSVRAVNEYMEEILKTMEHLIFMRHGLDSH
jgi:molybdopterin adenylyltransferase